eukprot:Rhum_TRINITY_DN472_c0_g1::Rhum_TRINITY_DN472_c0_g1_i1::g.1300::m.1300
MWRALRQQKGLCGRRWAGTFSLTDIVEGPAKEKGRGAKAAFSRDPDTDAGVVDLLKRRHLRNFHTSMKAHVDKWKMLHSEFKRLEPAAGEQAFYLYLLINANQGMYSTCWHTVQKMEKRGIKLSYATCAILLSGTVNGGNISGPYGFLQARALLLKQGHKMSASTYARVFTSLGMRHRMWRKARETKLLKLDAPLQLMKVMLSEDKLRPDEACWRVILATRATSAEGLGFWDRMLASGTVSTAPLYAALMHTCLTTREPRVAEGILRMAERDGVAADAHMLGTLLAIYKQDGTERSLQRAMQTWDHIAEAGLYNAVVVTTVISLAIEHTRDSTVNCARRAFVLGAKLGPKNVDKSMLHEMAVLLCKVNDVRGLKRLYEYCEANDLECKKVQNLQRTTRNWSVWEGTLRERSSLSNPGAKVNQTSLQVDMIQPFKKLALPKKSSLPSVNVVTPADIPVRRNPAAPIVQPPLAAPQTPQAKKRNKPPTPSWS